MIINLFTANVRGVQGQLIDVEVDISPGLPIFHIVGLGDTTVQEARERIRAAIKNSGLEFPMQRITVNLAPAHLPKEGAAFDFPIAMGIIIASKQCTSEYFENTLLLGELSMTGKLRPIKAVLPLVLSAKASGISRVMLPKDNAIEASIAENLKIIPINSLEEVLEYFHSGVTPSFINNSKHCMQSSNNIRHDIADVIGQSSAKRALEISAAGGHNLLFIGPPGCGKTMLATRLSSILPPLSEEEAMEVASVRSSAGEQLEQNDLSNAPPFRSPHHTISTAGLVGGGYPPRPGEVTLAHHGVLFMDETPEFHRDALEALRQPLETQSVKVSRTRYNVTFPASFTLIGAMNPCSCGYFGDPAGNCRCSQYDRNRYIAKLSGPLLDRIDLHVEVPRVKSLNNASLNKTETSNIIRAQVIKARKIQEERSGQCNAKTPFEVWLTKGSLTSAASNFIQNAMEKLSFSTRAYHRILSVARTIADLDGNKKIEEKHVAEALYYRCLDRKYWRC